MTPEQLKEFRDIASSYTVTFKHTRLHERNSMNRELLDRCLDALESLNAMSYTVGKQLMDDIEAELDKPDPKPVAEVSGHSYSTTRRFIDFLPAGRELDVGTKLYTK